MNRQGAGDVAIALFLLLIKKTATPPPQSFYLSVLIPVQRDLFIFTRISAITIIRAPYVISREIRYLLILKNLHITQRERALTWIFFFFFFRINEYFNFDVTLLSSIRIIVILSSRATV